MYSTISAQLIAVEGQERIRPFLVDPTHFENGFHIFDGCGADDHRSPPVRSAATSIRSRDQVRGRLLGIAPVFELVGPRAETGVAGDRIRQADSRVCALTTMVNDRMTGILIPGG